MPDLSKLINFKAFKAYEEAEKEGRLIPSFPQEKSYPNIGQFWTEWRNEFNEIHRDDGPAIEYRNGKVEFWLYGHIQNIRLSLQDKDFQQKHPLLFAAMVVYQVHNS